MKNVLHLPTWFPSKSNPLSGTFIQKQILAIAGADPNLDHYVLPIEVPFTPLTQPLRWLKKYLQPTAIVEKQTPNLTLAEPDFLVTHQQLFGDLSVQLFRQVCRIIEKQKRQVDLIHAHITYTGGAVAMCLSQRYGVPYIISEHMGPFPFINQRAPSFAHPFIIEPVHGAAAVVAVSQFQKKEIEDFSGIDRVQVIPNIVSIAPPLPSPAKTNEIFNFVLVGMLSNNVKGVDVLIEAVALLKKSTSRHFLIHIVGSGDLEPSLKAMAGRLGVEGFFQWHGALSHDRTLAIVQQSDAFICASRHESFGVAIVEALSCGKPVLATNCGGPADTVNETNGRLVAKENPAALADGIIWMLDHLKTFDRDQIVSDVRKKYSPSVVAAQYLEIYERCGLHTNRASL